MDILTEIKGKVFKLKKKEYELAVQLFELKKAPHIKEREHKLNFQIKATFQVNQKELKQPNMNFCIYIYIYIYEYF